MNPLPQVWSLIDGVVVIRVVVDGVVVIRLGAVVIRQIRDGRGVAVTADRVGASVEPRAAVEVGVGLWG